MLYRIFTFLLTPWIYLSFVWGQDTDRLKTQLALADSVTKLSILETLIGQSLENDVDKALPYIDQYEGLSQALDRPSNRLLANLFRGQFVKKRLADYDSAYFYYLQTREEARKLNHIPVQVAANLLIGKLFRDLQNYDRSFPFFQMADSLAQITNDSLLLIDARMQWGQSLQHKGQTEAARKAYEEALKWARSLDKETIEAELVYRMGAAYLAEGNPDAAMASYRQANILASSIKDKPSMARSFEAIGKLLLRNRSFREANDHFRYALRLWQVLQNKSQEARLANEITSVYFHPEVANYNKGRIYLDTALTAAREAEDITAQRDAYKLLIQFSKTTGNFQQALAYQERMLGLDELIRDEESDRVLNEIQNLIALEKLESQVEGLTRENEIRELKLRQTQTRFVLSAIIGAAILVGAIIAFLQYRRYKKQKEQTDRANTILQEQKRELESLNATKSKFFSIIGHDLKGPINSLRGFSHLMANHAEQLSVEEIKKTSSNLDESLKNLGNLLENLLEWARSQTGKIAYEPEVLDGDEILKQSVSVLEDTSRKKEIELKVQVTEPVKLYADKNLLTTVIRNLVSNALKFTSSRGRVIVEILSWKDHAEVKVSDNGTGMPKKVKEKLFQAGEKISMPGTANEKGTGLGLLLCKEFVEINGGTIWAESEEGKGSSFHFTVPLAPNSPPIPDNGS